MLKKPTVTFTIDTERKEQLKTVSRRRGISETAIARSVLYEYMERHVKKARKVGSLIID